MMLFVGFILLLFMSYLSWLLYAALKFPVPFVYNLRSLWQRKSSTLTTASAISLVVAIFIVGVVPRPRHFSSICDLRFT